MADLPPGTKYDKGRAPVDLVDPEFIRGTAVALVVGAIKYAPWNHLGGFDSSRIYASVLRHVGAWFMGERCDADSKPYLEQAGFAEEFPDGCPHLYMAAAQLMFLCHQMEGPHAERYAHLDSRPKFAECEVKTEDKRWS